MDPAPLRRHLLALDEPRGPHSRLLRIGDWRIRLGGLDAGLTRMLGDRWGGFLLADDGTAAQIEVELRRGDRCWLESTPGEIYRVEAVTADSLPLVRSYHFAAGPAGRDGHVWRAAITERAEEPLARVVENLTRYLVARLAALRGGIALHGAGILRDGRAYLFCGASGAGKSTLVGLSAPWTSLGDDYAVAVPAGDGWGAPAVPFDNSERAPARPPSGVFPLAGIWRLHQARESRVERVPAAVGAASMLSCIAFPGAMQDLLGAVSRQAERLAADGRFAHLHFARSPDVWDRIVEDRRRD